MHIKTQMILFAILFLAACQSPTTSSEPTEPTEQATVTTVAQSTETPEKSKTAPVLVVQDQDGQQVDFGQLYSEGIVMVFFYPKAGTPGCTDQACSLRDAYEELTDEGITVVGVSMDDRESQKEFQKDNNLPFTLIPDVDGKLLEAFGVGSMGGFASRQAFLIKDGMIEWHDDSASTSEQAADVLAEVRQWKK